MTTQQATKRFTPALALVCEPVDENGSAYVTLHHLSAVENTNAAIWRIIKNPPSSLVKKANGSFVARADYEQAGYTVCPENSQDLYKEDFTKEEWDVIGGLFSHPAPSIN